MGTVAFYGRLQDVAGGASRQMDLASLRTVEELVAVLASDNAELGVALNEPTIRCIVDDEIVPRRTEIAGAREVAFIPPVGGG